MTLTAPMSTWLVISAVEGVGLPSAQEGAEQSAVLVEDRHPGDVGCDQVARPVHDEPQEIMDHQRSRAAVRNTCD